MTRLIDADVLMQKIETYLPTFSINPSKIVELVENAPTIEERPHGKWIKANETDIKCSVCGHREDCSRLLVTELNFCSLCGARMREGDENE